MNTAASIRGGGVCYSWASRRWAIPRLDAFLNFEGLLQRRMRFPYVTCVILLAGCATASAPIPFTQDFTLEVRDAPQARRFDLVLVAGASPICFGIEQWPDRNGRVDTGSIARVVTEAGTFEARSYNFGYCPACELRVPAHGRFTGSISYAEFPEAAQVSPSRLRRLEFSFRPYSCR